jgi:hypothetical protein
VNLYLDTEFNGHGGQLISMALVGDDGREWYEVLPLPAVVDPWVAENVVPKLGKEPIGYNAFRKSLWNFLLCPPSIVVVADHQADFVYFFQALIGDSFVDTPLIKCGARLLAGTNPRPKVPHNALSDARALREWAEDIGL